MTTIAIGRSHEHTRTAEACKLCLEAAQPRAAPPRDTRFRPVADALLPWLLALGLVVPFAVAVEGEVRLLASGVAAGILVGAAFAWELHRRDRATGLAATARVRTEVGLESDARANSMLVQFEWAVNDIATLRKKLDAAENEAREHAQHAFVAERDLRRIEHHLRVRDRRSAVRAVAAAQAPETAPEPDVIKLRCKLNDAGPLAWLDLQADDPDNLPSRVRVFERGGNVICVSDPAIHGVSTDGVAHAASLRMPLAPYLASAVRQGTLDDYRFEALVAHSWIGVKLVASIDSPVKDKRGRVYRRA